MGLAEPSPSSLPSSVEPGSALWWAERHDRLQRRRPRAEGFTVEQIVECALSIVDDEGLEALTVRHLARRLDTGSATLYRHVASRDELLVLLVDRVLGDVQYPPDDLPGREQVVWLSTELRRVLMDHPDLVPALRAAPLIGPNALKGSEHALASLLSSGLALEIALPAYLALIDYVLGTVFFDTGRSSPRHLDDDTDGLPFLSPGDFPTLSAHSSQLDVPSEADVFAFGLRTFLDGLDARFLAVGGAEDGPHAITDR